MSRRAILLAALALVTALPAAAIGLSGGPKSLAVSAALGDCGLVEQQIACRVDVSWDGVAGARSYSVTVTAPGGGVVGSAETSGTGASLWIPYSGAGDYEVIVTAWGEGEDGAEPEVIAQGSFGTEGGDRADPRDEGDAPSPEPEAEPGLDEDSEPSEPEPEPQETAPAQPAADDPADAPQCRAVPEPGEAAAQAEPEADAAADPAAGEAERC